jgi:hypothetical protein
VILFRGVDMAVSCSETSLSTDRKSETTVTPQ